MVIDIFLENDMSQQSDKGYRLIDTNPRMSILLLDDMICFDEAVTVLQGKIDASLSLSPANRIVGIVVLPKGSPQVSADRLLELSDSRIMVHISEMKDLHAGALKVEQAIMQQYETAKKHL